MRWKLIINRPIQISLDEVDDGFKGRKALGTGGVTREASLQDMDVYGVYHHRQSSYWSALSPQFENSVMGQVFVILMTTWTQSPKSRKEKRSKEWSPCCTTWKNTSLNSIVVIRHSKWGNFMLKRQACTKENFTKKRPFLPKGHKHQLPLDSCFKLFSESAYFSTPRVADVSISTHCLVRLINPEYCDRVVSRTAGTTSKHFATKTRNPKLHSIARRFLKSNLHDNNKKCNNAPRFCRWVM
jgi:hypothetical protein